ncbi:hypothetical protein BOX15_Mlig003584g1, partial [Macrostomum lignano]
TVHSKFQSIYSMGEFIGAQLQLDCGPLLGTFVGTVVDVSNEKVTLRDASRNGLPSDTSEVTLHRSSIVSIVMLQSKDALAAAATTSASTETAKQQPKKQQLTATSASATSAAAIAKQQRTAEKLMSIPNATPAYICSSPPVKAPSHFSGSNKKKQQQPKDSPMQQQQQQRGVTPTRKTPIGEQQYRQQQDTSASVPGNNGGSAFVPYRGSKLPQQNASAQKQQPRHNAFSMSAGDMMDDFDFEGNLALFDKQAFYAMVDSGQTPEPDLVRTAQPPQPEPKLRPDQSVLLPGGAAPAAPSIQVPCKVDCQFATDVGLPVPSVTEELRVAVLSAADKAGLTAARLAEAFGRSASEFLVQQMGGASRLQPGNQHQLPQVAVLVGPGRRGLMGLSMARHLANKEVRVHVYCSERELAASSELAQEVQLFRTTGCPVVHSCRDLPWLLDYIVLATSEPDSPEHTLALWCRSNRAPVVGVCPQQRNPARLECKINLQYCLPVPVDAGYGSTYLVDAGITKHVYRQVGILYASPFGHRSVVQLHAAN